MAVTENTLSWLRYAETNLRDIAAKMAEESDPTVRVLAAHALRYLEKAEREADHETASRLLYGEIPAAERELADAAASEHEHPGGAMVKEEVGADDVAEVVASWTGIPAGRLLEGETAKLLRMESALGARLVGQAAAVQAVSDAVRRARA